MIICYTFPEIQRVRCNFCFSFWVKKSKLKKKKKKKNTPGEIIILHMCTKNYDHMMYGS